MSEKYEGLSPSKHQLLEEQVDKLQGDLLVIHGLLDNCILPAATFRFVEALQKANKDFDLILQPSMGHVSSSDYLTRRVWDYLIRHLLKVEPPKEFKLDSSTSEYDVSKLNDE